MTTPLQHTMDWMALANKYKTERDAVLSALRLAVAEAGMFISNEELSARDAEVMFHNILTTAKPILREIDKE